MPAPVTRSRRSSDPLTAALQPPQDESPASRDARLTKEREAKKVSDTIDEQLRLEKEALKSRLKNRKEIRILLLGQSESGKSTTLKQFQLAYAPNAFREEHLAWRPVVYLNLVRSVRRIIEALSPSDIDVAVDDDDANSPTKDSPSKSNSDAYVPRPATAQGFDTSSIFALEPYASLKRRLEPLLNLEDQLMKKLAGTDEDEATQLAYPMPSTPPMRLNGKQAEASVNNRHNWKRALNKLTGSKASNAPNDIDGWWNDPNDLCHVLNRCRPDIERLWSDPTIQNELKMRRLRLEESSGFYLDSLERVTDIRYIPTDDDVLKARLKTVGVVEHTFALEIGKQKGVDWKIYDVGGARSQRHAWIPYFTDINALIFLAPISAFDQVLAEDPRVNRVEDSLLLWRSVVSNKLLANVNIILFLNKCDLLQAKLEAGVRLNHYMTSYGDRPNDYESVSKYFRNKFLALSQSYSPNSVRQVYLHLTAVTDTRRTSSIINNVRDIILRDDLRDIKLL